MSWSQCLSMVEAGRDAWRLSSLTPSSEQDQPEQVAQGWVLPGFEYL